MASFVWRFPDPLRLTLSLVQLLKLIDNVFEMTDNVKMNIC
jgi:hypothetical protein